MADQISTTAPKGTNVQVAIRCRPPNEEEKKGNHASVVSCNQQNKQVSVNYGGIGKKQQKMFSFDNVFGMYSTQQEVFDCMVRPIVEETLAGFNCTIFAYGQTGTGKTHTMEGDIYSEEDAGIVPRSVRTILEQLETRGAEFTIRVSFLELYNEELQDLLTTDVSGKDKGALRLCEDVKKGVVCQNLEEITVLNVNDIFEILKRGIKQRQTAATLCNKNSSRSHSIFTMKIMIKETNVEGEEVIRNGQLNLVDLAGSECIGRSGAKNARAREAGSINQSLLTLGRVITALVDHHGHIPYRDSKLTRLLQESLGGKAKTCIIATLSPSQLAVEESLSTLDYASKAKSIKNVPQVNQKMTKKTVMKEYCAEIESLRNMLQITREKNGIYVDPATFENMESRLSSQELQLSECEAVLAVRNDEIKGIRSEVEAVRQQCEEAQAELEEKAWLLEDSERALDAQTAETERLQTEWQASEAVVSEQEVTETSLSTHVADLQATVSHCHDDLSGLFGKIDRHAAKERERVQHAEQFSAEVAAKQSRLAASIAESLSASQGQSQELCEGVGALLAKGKNVCAEFEQSIAQALVVLVGDTTAAKDTMVGSCAGLDQTLAGTKQEVILSLQTLQQTLSTWLGDVQSNMGATQAVLARQQESLAEFKTAVAVSHQEFVTKNTDFVSVQKDFSASLLTGMTDLKTDITSSVAAFQNEVKQSAAKNQTEMRAKSAALQRAMSELLGELVQEQEEHSSAMVSSTAAFSTAVTATASGGLDRLVDASRSANTNLLHLNSELVNSAEKSSSQFRGMVESSQALGQEVEAQVCGVVETVGDKRAFLDETAASLAASVTKSMDSAHDSVKETSSTAETMVQNVTQASEKMKSSCAQSMDSFTEFLGGKGEEINSELVSHFQVLGETLAEDLQIVQQVTAESRGFLEQMQQGVLRPTGSTPQKRAPAAAREAQRTRPHEIIKQDSRAGVSFKRALDEQLGEQSSSECGAGESSRDKDSSFPSPSKAAKLSSGDISMEDAENIAPTNLSSSSRDEEEEGEGEGEGDDQSACSKASAASSKSASSSSTRGLKRSTSSSSSSSSKSLAAASPPKLKRTSSKTRAAAAPRAVL